MPKYEFLSLSEDQVDDMIGLIDGCLGTSEDESFNKQFKPILKRLKKLQQPGKIVNDKTKKHVIQNP